MKEGQWEEIQYCQHLEEQTEKNIELIEVQIYAIQQDVMKLMQMQSDLKEQKVGLEEYRKSLYLEVLIK